MHVVARFMIVSCGLAAACAQAGGDPRGGELTDAGAEAEMAGEFTPPVFDAGSECGEGSKWSELYRDIFGPTGKPGSCSFQANCHGSPDGDGAKSGAGIQCFDEKTCRETMISRNLAKPSNAAAPEKALLFSFIRNRKPDGKLRGIMPRVPADYVFPDACLVRMKAWIANGVPAD